MRASRGPQYQPRVLVKVDPEQKENHTVVMPDGSKKALWLGTKYSEDNKSSQPTMAIAVSDCEEIRVGDILLFTHLVLIGKEQIQHENYLGVEKLYCIDKASVVCIIRDNEVLPVGDNLICERLFYPEEISGGGIILSSEKKQIKDRLRVLKVSPNIEDVSVGDIIVTYPFSDYELIFNMDNVRQSIIRCNFTRDVIAIDSADYSKY